MGGVSFTNCVFGNNTAYGITAGGAVIHGDSGYGALFKNCTFVYNTASGGTAAIAGTFSNHFLAARFCFYRMTWVTISSRTASSVITRFCLPPLVVAR